MKLRHYLTIAISIIILGVWINFLAAPEYKERLRLKASIIESESRLTDYRNTMIEFHEQFKSHQELLNQKEHLISRLYSKDDIIMLFGDLAIKSSKYNVIVTEFSPSVVELIALNQSLVEGDEPLHLDITIKMRGQIPNVGRFIGEVESQNYYKGFNYCHIRNLRENDPISNISYSFKAILGALRVG